MFVDGANGEKEPVVFLLGWLGAEDRHLAKYCSIYNQRGFVFVICMYVYIQISALII